MNYFPLGEIEEARYELSKKYKLVEFINGVYRLTQKCRDNYDEMSYIKYLRGEIPEPTKVGKETVIADLLSL
jgi:hypothetical protein